MSELDSVTQAPSDTGASAPADAIIQQPAASVTATPQTGTPAGTTSQPPEGYVPSYRIRETREAALREASQQWGSREQQYQSQLEQVQRQLHALVGVQPDQNPEATAIRRQFEQLFPGLAQLEQKSKDLLGMVDRTGDLDSQNKHYWTEYGRQRMDNLYSKASTALGAPLNDKGKRLLHTAFSGYVNSSPEIAARYTQDPTLVDEFWNDFGSNFIEPVRRSATATVDQQVGQRALPRDTPSGAPQVMSVPKPKDLDERMGMAWNQYTATRK